MPRMAKNKPGARRPQQDNSKSRPPGKEIRRKVPLSNYLSRAILILGCIVPFLPLVVDYDYYFPYIFLKSIQFRIAVQAMAFIYSVLALISPPHRPRFRRISYALMIYFGVMLLSSLPGVSSGSWDSWWGDFARMGGMFAQLHLLIYFLVLSQSLKQEREWMTLFAASLLSGVFLGLTGLIQYLGLDFLYRFSPEKIRVEGATGNPNFFAAHMLLNFFLAIYFLARKDRKQIYAFAAQVWLLLLIASDAILAVWDIASGGRILSAGLDNFPIAIFALILHGLTLLWFALRNNAWAGAAFFSILALYYLFWMNLSQTRAAVAGLAGSFVFMAALYLWKGAGKRWKWAAAAIIFLLILSAPALFRFRDAGWIQANPLFRRLSATSLNENRFMAWKAGVEGMLDRPVFGWGPEHYSNAFDLHAPARLFRGPTAENWFDRAHNIILDVGTTTGFLGLAAFLSFYGIVFASLLDRWRRTESFSDSLAIAGLLAAYLLQNLFSFDTVNTDGIVFLTLAYVAYLCDRPEPAPAVTADTYPARPAISWKSWLVLAASAAILVCGYLYTAKGPQDANLLLNRAIAMEKAGDPGPRGSRYVYSEAALEYFRQAEDYATTGRHQVREELANYAIELAKAAEVPLGERAQAAKRAAASLERSISEDPADARHYMYAASLINGTFAAVHQSDPGLARSLAGKSLSFLRKAEILSPDRPRLFLERAYSLMQLGRFEDAVPELQKALALDPKDRASRISLIEAYVAAGRLKDAEEEWKTIKTLRHRPPEPSEYEKVIEIYVSRKQFAPVVALYQEQLQASPNQVLLLSRLAAAYRESGNMDLARQTALKAAALAPQIAPQLEKFLKSLDEKR